MNWFKNLSVRWKIIAVAGLGIVAFLGYFSYSYMVGNASISELEKIEAVDFAVLEASSQNNLTLYGARDALVRAIENGDQAALEEASRLARLAISNLKAIASMDPELEGPIEEMITSFSHYYEETRDIAAAMISGAAENDDRFYDRLNEVSALRAQFEAQLDEFQEERYAEFYGSLTQLRESTTHTQVLGIIVVSVAGFLLVLITWRVTRSIIKPLDHAVSASDSIASGDWNKEIIVESTDETGRLLQAIRLMRDTLKARKEEEQREEKLKNQLSELGERIRGDMSIHELGDSMLGYVVPVLHAQVGAFYKYDADTHKLTLSSSYALKKRKNLSNEFELGESLVGQCALERKQIAISNVPEDYLPITSGTGSATPGSVIVTPIMHENELKGVLEVAALRDFDDEDMEFLEQGVASIAIAVHTADSRTQLARMLEQTKAQAEELETQKRELSKVNEDLEKQAMDLSASEARLQQQQEELRATNEELEAQTQALRASEESLQAQQEELRVTNEELESQASILAEQKAEMSQKNKELEILRDELQDKIKELELSSKYKSEFLSTMSHELRTPLNSILILSNALADNKKGNLLEKQVEHAQVIHSAGSDLLSLINDILDISKIEEGKMDVVIDDIEPEEFGTHFKKHFAHIAENKGLEFKLELGDALPEYVYTDRQRLEQIIKNLLSNSMKFTEQGSVTLRIDRPPQGEALPNRELNPESTIRFSVIDTGIGIPLEKQKMIFEAFQQADGTTSRKYGGTGLGLTISRELSRLLGGEISIYSEGEGKGSSFMLYLPYGDAESVHQDVSEDTAMLHSAAPVSPVTASNEQQDNVEETFVVREKTVLVIEDDKDFAAVLVGLAEDYGLEGHVCDDGESGLEYARHYRPSAIILDIGLPGMDGWEVMEKLKADQRTKDIPVHFLSGKDERKKAMELGAIDFLTKPVSTEQVMNAFDKIQSAVSTNVRKLLVVEDSEIQHESIKELFDEKGVAITPVTTGADALQALKDDVYDCIILDLTLPDMTGFELMEKLNEDENFDAVPIIIYTGKDLSREEEARLRKYADRIILKTERSSERLLNEASLFLHWLESNMPSRNQETSLVEHRDDIFEGKHVLLVDDDMRNIYALSAQLEELGFDITIANNGREALEALDENPSHDLVLMDIMMPEMDGYEAMREIRKQPRFEKLPIISLTAKAMKDDKAKCIEAGANDYCSKPIDMAKLTSLMRVWLHK